MSRGESVLTEGPEFITAGTEHGKDRTHNLLEKDPVRENFIADDRFPAMLPVGN